MRLLGLGAGDALALPQAVELLGVLLEARRTVAGSTIVDALEVQVQLLRCVARIFASSPSRIGMRDLLVQQDLAGAQDLAFLAFGEDDPLGVASAPC